MPYKIAIANEKGGVAKTTTAVSLGGALRERGQRVLMIDMDPQANMTLALGLKPEQITNSISNVLLNSENILNVIQNTKVENIDILPSSHQMSKAERFLPIRQNYDSILKNALDGNIKYDFVLIDCPPALGAISLNALTAANLLLIPTQAEYFSTHALKNMMSTIRNVRDQNNPSLIYRVLITMYDRRNRTHRTLLEQLNSTFGNFGLLKTVIEVDTKLRESPIVGVPIMDYTKQARSAQQYRDLAQELLQDVEKIKETAAAQST